MEYYVYALFSPKFNKIYVGFTADVDGRLISHNQLATQGWTIKFRPWTKVHQEKFTTKKEAMAREKQLKSSRGRHWIKSSILQNL